MRRCTYKICAAFPPANDMRNELGECTLPADKNCPLSNMNRTKSHPADKAGFIGMDETGHAMYKPKRVVNPVSRAEKLKRVVEKEGRTSKLKPPTVKRNEDGSIEIIKPAKPGE
jgi:hypothetical protein